MTIGMTADEHLKAINKRLEDSLEELEDEFSAVNTSLNIARGQASDRAKRVRQLSEERKELQEQLTAAEEHAAQLEQILDAAEAANYKHLARIDKLEQLCRDMYYRIKNNDRVRTIKVAPIYTADMDALGLLEEE